MKRLGWRGAAVSRHGGADFARYSPHEWAEVIARGACQMRSLPRVARRAWLFYFTFSPQDGSLENTFTPHTMPYARFDCCKRRQSSRFSRHDMTRLLMRVYDSCMCEFRGRASFVSISRRGCQIPPRQLSKFLGYCHAAYLPFSVIVRGMPLL